MPRSRRVAPLPKSKKRKKEASNSLVPKATIIDKDPNKASSESSSSIYAIVPADFKKYEKIAPEIQHLKLHREIERNPKPEPKKKSKLYQWFMYVLCCVEPNQEFTEHLDDLNPVQPRTDKSVTYIATLAEGTIDTNAKDKEKQQLFQKAYKAALEGFNFLEKANDGFRCCTLMLTFSQYSSGLSLKDADKDLIQGRSILGSYTWMATIMLQQLQADAEIEIKGYSKPDMQEIVQFHEMCVCQSLFMWESMLCLLEAVEGTHDYVEKIFSDLLQKAGKQSKEASITAARHIKIYKSFDRQEEEMKKLNRDDPRITAKAWAKVSLGPLRILFKDTRTSEAAEKSWQGFDVQTRTTKLYTIKLLYRQIFQISSGVLEQIQNIAHTLHTIPLSRKIENLDRNIAPSSVLSLEDGLYLMNKWLEESSPQTWSAAQIQNLLEIYKICLDHLDLLTLSAATIRTLAYDIRQILHITYDTCRTFHFEECKSMAPYENIVKGCRKDFPDMWERATKEKEVKKKLSKKLKSLLSLRKSTAESKKKYHASRYDVEEPGLGFEEAEKKFKNSDYSDIIKIIPIVLQNGTISLALQDPETVFSESSESLLSDVQPRDSASS